MIVGELGRNRGERRHGLQRQLLPAELAHELDLVFDEDELALADHAHTIGHLLGLVDVVRGQDDGHAVRLQRAHQHPHVPPELNVDASGRLVEEQDPGSWDNALAISSRRFMPPDSVMILLSFLSHSDRSAAPSRCARGWPACRTVRG